MNNVSANLNIYFKEPYWVGEYRRVTGGNSETCEILFDYEPPTYIVYKYLLENFNKLNFKKSTIDKEISSTM